MKLSELKQFIENPDLSIPNELMVFVYEDSSFLAKQYLNAICEKRNLQKNIINSLTDISDNSALSLVFDFSARLNVLITDTFDEISDDYDSLTNVIILCHKIDKAIEKKVKDFVIKFPKLKDWQVLDYLKLKYKGVSAENLDWLYKVTKGSIDRLENELDKTLLFEEKDRNEIVNKMKADIHTDLFVMDYFELPSALYQNNATGFRTVVNYLLHRDLVDLDPISLTVQLLNKYKQCLFLVKHPEAGLSAADLGMSTGAAYYAKKDAPRISDESLRRRIEFLASIDSRMKQGLIDMPKEQFIDYIICNIMAM